jgi:phosphatidate phosphatase PAH1
MARSMALAVLRTLGTAVFVFACSGCGSEDSGSENGTGDGNSLPSCANSKIAIVTDIDETLTTADEEFFPMQTSDGNYDPKERESASALMQGYADRGYFIVYLTARFESLTVAVTNETARQATDRWLREHRFPVERSELVLAESFVFGETARTYKAAALRTLQNESVTFDYAYGNADSDVRAYADAAIPKEATFIIGELAGFEGTVAVAGEGWTAHLAEQLPKVDAVCKP